MNPRPLTGPSPAEMPLPDAPLARVIAQVRFPKILAIRNPDKTAAFQERIRASYPFLSDDRFRHVVLTPDGGQDVSEGLIWRFADRENKPRWRLSLGVDFVALETSDYESRRDFLSRLSKVVVALEADFKPAEVQRLGLRYIDRLKGDAVARIAELIQPKVLGIVQPTDEPPASLREAVVHVLTEAHFLAEEGVINARWGSLPSNATYDPNALEPIDEPSWVLDLDMFTPSPQPFESGPLMDTATRFAERLYAIFREMVTDEFLRFYGGEP